MDCTSDSGGIAVRMLGRFQIVAGGRVVIDHSWPRRKAMALVKLLALRPGRAAHREAVLDLLWPELDVRAASNNLRQSMHHLRAALAAAGVTVALIVTQGTVLALAPDAVTDVEEFRAKAARARTSGDARAYADALALYTGDLLPEDLYQPWTERPRDEARNLSMALLLELSRLQATRGDSEDAMSNLHRLLAAEPAHEEAHRALMVLYAETGARYRALRQYLACQQALDRELGVEPLEETQALYREIAAGRLSAAAHASPQPGRAKGSQRPSADRS